MCNPESFGLINRQMKHAAALVLVTLALGAHAPGQGTTNVPPKRNWLGRMLHPFNSGSTLPEYKDPRLRGLAIRLELSPQPVKLSEVRLLDVKVTLTNMSKHPTRGFRRLTSSS